LLREEFNCLFSTGAERKAVAGFFNFITYFRSTTERLNLKIINARQTYMYQLQKLKRKLNNGIIIIYFNYKFFYYVVYGVWREEPHNLYSYFGFSS